MAGKSTLTRTPDWGWAASVTLVLAGTLPAVLAGFPRGADALLHAYRVWAFHASWMQGNLWPRLSPDLAWGYGYPVFHFYAPLTYALGAAWHLLGADLAWAVTGLMALAVVLGALGVGALAADLWEPRAAWLAASAYATAPYILFNVYGRAALPELWGLALWAWALWALVRAAHTPTRSVLAVLMVALAGLALAHNLTFVWGTAALLGVWAWHVAHRSSGWREAGVAGALGLALSAFFWVPAFTETASVQVSQLTAPDTLNFRYYFIGLADLARFSFVFDPFLQADQIPVAFGGGLALAAGVGAGLGLAGPQRVRVAVVTVATGATVFLAVAASQPVWEAVPLLAVMQFPWRWLGPASILAAVLVGGWVRLAVGRAWLAGALVVGLALSGWAWTYAQTQPTPEASRAGLLALESQGQMGTTATNEFLPVGVRQFPAQPWAGPRLLPGQAAVRTSTESALAAMVTVQASAPLTLTWQWFYFPGWQASLNGQPWPITPSDPHGWVQVVVPPGDHTVQVAFGLTPAWQGWLGLAGLAAVLALGWFGRMRPLARQTDGAVPVGAGWPPWSLALTLGVLAARLLWGNAPSPVVSSRWDGAQVRGAATPLNITFRHESGEALVLAAAEGLAVTQPADAPLPLTLYWHAPAALSQRYAVSVRLRDARGHISLQLHGANPGGWDTPRWQAGGYAPDRYTLHLPLGTLPGVYEVLAVVYRVADGAVLNAQTEAGQPLGWLVPVGQVTLTAPAQPVLPTSFTPTVRLADPVIFGVDMPFTHTMVGDLWPATLYVQPESARDLRLWLAGPAQTWPLTQVTLPPLAGFSWRVPLAGLIPPEVPAGTWPVLAQLGARPPVTLTLVHIAVPERQLQKPPWAQATSLKLGDQVALLGYNVSYTDTLTVQLAWQPLARLTTHYTVFVQVLSASGAVVAQVDRPPVNGTRPTTGWLSPEVVLDVYTLDVTTLPPGSYTVQVGLYDSLTGTRLPTNQAGDAVIIAWFSR